MSKSRQTLSDIEMVETEQLPEGEALFVSGYRLYPPWEPPEHILERLDNGWMLRFSDAVKLDNVGE